MQAQAASSSGAGHSPAPQEAPRAQAPGWTASRGGEACSSTSSLQGAAQAQEEGEEAARAWRDRGREQHGCKHYRRRCRMVAPCCGEVFWCRHCHNELKTANEWVRGPAASSAGGPGPAPQVHRALFALAGSPTCWRVG